MNVVTVNSDVGRAFYTDEKDHHFQVLSQFAVWVLSPVYPLLSTRNPCTPLSYYMPALYFIPPAVVSHVLAWLHLSGVFMLFAMPAFLVSTPSTFCPLDICCCALITYGLMKILARSIFLDLVLATLPCHFCRMTLLWVKSGNMLSVSNLSFFAVSIPWPQKRLYLVPRFRTESGGTWGVLSSGASS